MSGDFNPEQNRDLEGFVTGAQIAKAALDNGGTAGSAAMGQQDCGQCGYSCQDYSDAIFLKKGELLNLCVPGGKETARVGKALCQELNSSSPSPAAKAPAPTPTPAAATAARAAAPGCSRESPAEARFLSRTRLNRPAPRTRLQERDFKNETSRTRLGTPSLTSRGDRRPQWGRRRRAAVGYSSETRAVITIFSTRTGLRR
jgi:uncharacterized DUF497 family protein